MARQSSVSTVVALYINSPIVNIYAAWLPASRAIGARQHVIGLSWHVQKFVSIWWPAATELQQYEISIEFELRAKSLVKPAPASIVSNVPQRHCDVKQWADCVILGHHELFYCDVTKGLVVMVVVMVVMIVVGSSSRATDPALCSREETKSWRKTLGVEIFRAKARAGHPRRTKRRDKDLPVDGRHRRHAKAAPSLRPQRRRGRHCGVRGETHQAPLWKKEGTWIRPIDPKRNGSLRRRLIKITKKGSTRSGSRGEMRWI